MRFKASIAASFAAGVLLAVMPAAGQQAAAYRAPRTADGKANLNGIWQALNTANWDLEGHAASAGPAASAGILGAEFAVAPGLSVVDGDTIPYLPAAQAKRKQNLDNRFKDDPELKCYMPGVPRATYMPYPFQILQTGKDILIVYEYATSSRLINMGKPIEAGSDTWMGNSNGHWEGNTLVVNVDGLNGLAWFDRAGNFASDKMKVVERYTLTDKDHINYEATITDPSVFTRPWKINLTLYKRVEKNAQLLEFKCVEFAEELLYGQFKKK